MTDPDYTHLSLVVDRSASMRYLRQSAQSAIDELLHEQLALAGAFTYTLTDFNHDVRTVTRMCRTPVEYDMRPAGRTALLDAVGSEVVATGQDLAALPEHERPGVVMLVVVTDGMENASTRYRAARLRRMLEVQRATYGWECLFIGADESAWQGKALGVESRTYRPTVEGTVGVYRTLSRDIARRRCEPA